MDTDNKFFKFIEPYLTFIDKGHLFRKPFNWLYTLIAALNLLVPIFLLYQIIRNRALSGGASIVISIILMWLIIAFACWVGFQLWWDRRSKVVTSSTEGDDFVATPVYAHFLQTFGEWIGTFVAIVGAGSSLIAVIFGGGSDMMGLNLPLSDIGIAGIIVMPIYGFLVIVFTRFLAEMFRALAAIANNTKK